VPRDSLNPDPAKRNTPLCGLQLLGGFRPSPHTADKWEHGWVYDPATGSTYKSTAQATDANTVVVRGYILIPLLGRTVTLTRVVGDIDRCSVPAQDEAAGAATSASPHPVGGRR
jgi:hypothetical protein